MSYSDPIAAQTGFRRLAVGRRCLALIAQRYEYEGELVEEANVLFLQVGAAQWLRFFFDAGQFFCRVESKLTLAEFAEEGMKFVPTDLSARHHLVGQRIEQVEFGEFPDGAELRIAFEHAAILVLRNASDQSTVDITSPVA